jgi:hypothetical protein
MTFVLFPEDGHEMRQKHLGFMFKSKLVQLVGNTIYIYISPRKAILSAENRNSKIITIEDLKYDSMLR